MSSVSSGLIHSGATGSAEIRGEDSGTVVVGRESIVAKWLPACPPASLAPRPSMSEAHRPDRDYTR